MTVNLTGINTKAAFHHTMKSQLNFPNWYGEDWDAFWDILIAMVELPDCVVL